MKMVWFLLRLSDLRNATMEEQPRADQTACSSASVQTPHTVHINPPPAVPEDVLFTLIKCLLQATAE